MKPQLKVLFVLVVLLCIPGLIASAESVATTNPSIDVSFSEFYDNYDYYKELSKQYGYIVYIDCTSEECAEIQNLIGSNVSGADDLVANKSRSIYVPTTYWNVATQGAREINGASAKETLYTSKKFYGATSYEVVIQNLNASSLVFESHGAAEDLAVGLAANKTAYLTLDTNSAEKDDAFYLSFHAPCAVYGHIGAA